MAPIRPNPTLSEDLISEILIRVPVKSLLCFQSVSKTWLSLIKDPAFVKSQLNHAVKTLTHQTLIMSRYTDTRRRKFSLMGASSRQIVADLTFPYSRDEFDSVPYVRLFGSDNGIVCVVAEVEEKCSIYLWNPATRQSKVIPLYGVFGNRGVEDFELDQGFKYFKNSVCYNRGVEDFGLGFGYDKIDGDFKVFRVIRFDSPPFLCAEVYSDNRKAWRKVPDPIDVPFCEHFDVCVNGFLCGFGRHGMMAFDLNKEVMNCAIKLPVNYGDYEEICIIEFNKSVAVVMMVNSEMDWSEDVKINLWTLNDDACLRGGGVEASWTLMFSIVIVCPAGIDVTDTDIERPGEIILGDISNGDLLLLILSCDYVWISCNADKKEAKFVPLSVDMANHSYTRGVYKYTESLVSLAGFRPVNWKAGEDNN